MQKSIKSCPPRAGVAIAWGAAAALGAPCAAQTASFGAIEPLPGGYGGSALGVSADGGVVAGQTNAGSAARAFRWQTGASPVPSSIGLAPGWTGASAWAVSGDGTTIVGSGGDNGGHGSAFRWSEAGGFVTLPVLADTVFALAVAASHDGAIAAGTCYVPINLNPSPRPVRWTASGVQDLGTLPGGDVGEVRGMSADGAVVTGYHATATEYQAFRWTAAGGMVGLGMLPGELGSFGHAVSGDGSTIVGSSVYAVTPGQRYHPFRWTAAGGMQALPLPPGAISAEATGASHDGSVIVGYASGPGGGAGGGGAVVWTGAGAQHVATLLGPALPPGWGLSRANGVSADGMTIVGVGQGPCGSRAWVVRLDGGALPPWCYANCNGSCTPALSVADFACFQAKFVTQQAYADCDGSGTFTIADFGCFQASFAAGCP